jgi:hypothetical protein
MFRLTKLVHLIYGIVLILIFLSCTNIKAENIIEYIDLGRFQVELNRTLDIDVPYYKPDGITQIPSEYFRAFVIHELKADDKRILPTNLYPIWWNGSDDSVRGLFLTNTISEAEYLTLRLPWRAAAEDNNKAIKQGVTLSTYSNGRKKYTIPYGTQEISLIYSIRFLIYDPHIISNELTEILRSDKVWVKWRLEWREES